MPLQTQTHKLTASRPMAPEEFWGRVARNDQVRVAYNPGYLDVFRGDRHMARWLPYPQVLHYVPGGNGNGAADQWPPSCSDCGGSVGKGTR